MSTDYRQDTWPDRGTFEGTFDTLERVDFTEGPTTIESTADVTTVQFSTVATHSYGPEERSGTATLVLVNDEWKIDSINVA